MNRWTLRTAWTASYALAMGLAAAPVSAAEPVVGTTRAVPVVTCTTSGNVFRSGVDADANGRDDLWEVYLVTRPPFDRPFPPDRTLASVPVGGYSPAFIVTSPPGSWYSPVATPPRWIAHQANANHGFAEADVFYRATFALDPAVSRPAFELQLTFYADNTVYAIYVNGVREYLTALTAADNPWNAPGANTPVTFTLGAGATNNWVAGNNVIEVQVISGFAEQGFLVEAAAGPSCANSAPTASSVSIAGAAAVGASLTGTYSYADADGDAQSGSTFRWVRSTSNTLPPVGATVATSLGYTPTSADLGRFLFFCVTPAAAAGASPGTEVCSAAAGPVAASPAAIPVQGPWGLLTMAGLLAALGAWVLRRQRSG